MCVKIVFFVVIFQSLCGASYQNNNVTEEQYASMPPLFHFDDYDSCMLHGKDTLYCTLVFQLYPNNGTNTTDVWNIINTVSKDPRNYRHDILRHGVCLSKTCPNFVPSENNLTTIEEAITKCYRKKYSDFGLTGEVRKFHCDDGRSSYSVDVYDLLFGACFVLYAAFVVAASLYEGTARYRSREEYERITETKFGKFVSAFSVPKNFHRLKDTTPKNPDHEALSCIQGIRFYNMTCVILAHTIMVQFAAPVSNPIFFEKVNSKFLNSFLSNGGYAVQSFFLISGWLLTYNVFSTFEGKKKITLKSLLMIFVCRYIRLTAPLLVVLGFHSTWLVHLSRGPFWDKLIGEEYKNCRDNWWTNLLYVNNFVNKEKMQTWYLASDTQLFLLFLIVIYILKTFEKYSKLVLASVVGIGILIPSAVSYINNYDILVRQFPEPLYNYLLLVPQWHQMYSASYSNITGYAIGTIFGYLFYKTKHNNIVITKIHVISWWILSFGLPLSIILVGGRMYQDDYTYTRLESALYWGFGKPIFALGIAIGILGMSRNIGWICVWFCRWPPAQFLGRLTFSAYLVHVGWVKYRLAINRQPIYALETLLLQNWMGDIAMGYMLALVLTLMIEMPISALQKLFLQNSKY